MDIGTRTGNENNCLFSLLFHNFFVTVRTIDIIMKEGQMLKNHFSLSEATSVKYLISFEKLVGRATAVP